MVQETSETEWFNNDPNTPGIVKPSRVVLEKNNGELTVYLPSGISKLTLFNNG